MDNIGVEGRRESDEMRDGWDDELKE